jgi:N-methylhydantoinase A
VVLGYIRPGRLADGAVCIDAEAARRAVHDRIAQPLGLDLYEAAEGIHRIANARMMRALREVSTERGRDPRAFAFLAFGGSGPIHAAGLARELGIGRVIVPPLPGLFSALGLLFSGVEHHDVRSCLLSGPALTAEALQHLREEMRLRMLDRFRVEGYAAEELKLSWGVDVRFQGQASEIRIELDPGPLTEQSVVEMKTRFEGEHERLYGHRSDPDNPVEVVAVRLVGQAAAPGQPVAVHPAERLGEWEPSRRAYFGPDVGSVVTPVLARRDLKGTREGPLLIDEYDSTTVVPPFMRVRVDDQGNLVMEPHHG